MGGPQRSYVRWLRFEAQAGEVEVQDKRKRARDAVGTGREAKLDRHRTVLSVPSEVD